MQRLLTLATLVVSLCCGAREPATVRRCPPPRVEPPHACVAKERVAEVGLEVVPGLVLERVSGLPLGSAHSPLQTVQFHWTATNTLVGAPEIEMDVWARSNVGKTRVGIAKLSDLQLAPQLWRSHVCFPVSVELALPVARKRLKWELWVAVRAIGMSAKDVALGSVWVE